MARGAYKGRLAAVVHLGACSSTTETNWDYLRENNLEYSKTLCKASIDAGARFLQASSAATYGDGEHGYKDDHAGLDALKLATSLGFSATVSATIFEINSTSETCFSPFASTISPAFFPVWIISSRTSFPVV